MSKIVKGIVEDLKASTKAQHEVDAANFEAVKTESRVTWEEARVSPKVRMELMREDQMKQVEEAKARTKKAQERIDYVRAKNAAAHA